MLLTCGIDVQDDRFEREFVGWGRDEGCWSLDYQVIYGDPSAPAIWNEREDCLKQTYAHPKGVDLPIRATSIDSGGHYTSAVYGFVKSREARRIFAIKGVGGEGRALVSRPAKNNVGKVRLFPVGVDTAKELLYGRLKIIDPGPGYCHFPEGRDDEYFRQLTGEKIVTKYSQGRARRAWVKTRARNEALDVRVYAIAAFTLLNLNINRVAQRFKNKQAVKPVEPIDEPIMRRPAPRKSSGGFVNSWRGY